MTHQLDLLYSPRDPDTSREAADRVPEFRAAHDALIFSALSDNPLGLTSHEVAQVTRLDAVQVARRMKGLTVTAGVIDTGQRRLTPTGRNAVVWAIGKRA